jgi:hypothetical protein
VSLGRDLSQRRCQLKRQEELRKSNFFARRAKLLLFLGKRQGNFRECEKKAQVVSEEQTFRSEVDGFVPLSRHRSAVLRRNVELHHNDSTKAHDDVETSESDAFAAPRLLLTHFINCEIWANREIPKGGLFGGNTFWSLQR